MKVLKKDLLKGYDKPFREIKIKSNYLIIKDKDKDGNYTGFGEKINLFGIKYRGKFKQLLENKREAIFGYHLDLNENEDNLKSDFFMPVFFDEDLRSNCIICVGANGDTVTYSAINGFNRNTATITKTDGMVSIYTKLLQSDAADYISPGEYVVRDCFNHFKKDSDYIDVVFSLAKLYPSYGSKLYTTYTNQPVYYYYENGEVYLSELKDGKWVERKVGEDKEAVRKAIERQKEIMKSWNESLEETKPLKNQKYAINDKTM